MQSVFYLAQCTFYAPLVHVLRFPFSAFIALRSLYLFHCSLFTTLLHFFHLLTLYYDPVTTFNFCKSSNQLQFEPKQLLQPHNLTLLVNLTSGYVYEPIKISSPKSCRLIHSTRHRTPVNRSQPAGHCISESLLTLPVQSQTICRFT